MNKLRVLDLFSGIGGFSLGLEQTGGFETAAFCEIEEFPQQVLAKHWPDIPIHSDVRKLRANDVGSIDVITGGYPCQPFSTAGERRGTEDDRHLWPEVARLLVEIRPTWGVFENVYGHISMGLDEVLSDLEAIDYAAQCFVVPASAVGACHKRDRVWIVAHSNSDGEPNRAVNGSRVGMAGQTGHNTDTNGKSGKEQQAVAEYNEQGQRHSDSVQMPSDTASKRRSRQGGTKGRRCEEANGKGQADQFDAACGWPTEPPVCRADDGIPGRMDRHRLRALGNSIVPQIAHQIGLAILAVEAGK